MILYGLVFSWCFLGCPPGRNGPESATLRFLSGNGSPTDPTFVAVQEGEGEWIPPQSVARGEYTFELNDPRGRYGVAYVCQNNEVNLIYTTTHEIPFPFTIACPLGEDLPRGVIKGSLAGAMRWFVAIGDKNCLECSSLSDYSLNPPADRPLDLFAWAITFSSSLEVRFYLERGITVPGDPRSPVIRDLDFSRMASGISYPANITLSRQGDFLESWIGFLITQNGTFGFLPPRWLDYFWQPPPSLFVAEDLMGYILEITSTSEPYEERFLEERRIIFHQVPKNQEIRDTWDIPPLTLPAFYEITKIPYFRPGITFPTYSVTGMNLLDFQLRLQNFSSPTPLTWSVLVTPDRLPSLVIPDLTRVSGWQSSWGLGSDPKALLWSVSATVSETLTSRDLQQILGFYQPVSLLRYILRGAYGIANLSGSFSP
jgi:hypothetical protein